MKDYCIPLFGFDMGLQCSDKKLRCCSGKIQYKKNGGRWI